MSTDVKLMAFVIVLFFACGCTPATVPQQPTERARSTQYQIKIKNGEAVLWRNGKPEQSQPFETRGNDTVRTETKTTIEKY